MAAFKGSRRALLLELQRNKVSISCARPGGPRTPSKNYANPYCAFVENDMFDEYVIHDYVYLTLLHVFDMK